LFRVWYLEQRNVREAGAVINLLEFTNNEMTLQQNKRRVTGTKKAKSSALDKTLKAQDVFKGGKKDWRKFWGLFKAYLANQMNGYDVPMIYVLRNNDNDEGDNKIIGDHGLSHLIQDAPLTGDVLRKDNYKVGNYLDTFMLDGPGHTHIKDHLPDGRLVIHALLVYYRSDQATMLDDADSTLDSTKYYGEKKQFTFEMYTSRTLEA
jgi:hypothetical protein